jgi:hypothetical protein
METEVRQDVTKKEGSIWNKTEVEELSKDSDR